MKTANRSVGVSAEDRLKRAGCAAGCDSIGLDEHGGDADGVGAVDDGARALSAPHQRGADVVAEGGLVRVFVVFRVSVFVAVAMRGGGSGEPVDAAARAGDNLARDAAVGCAGDGIGPSVAVHDAGLVDAPEVRGARRDRGGSRACLAGAQMRAAFLERRGRGAPRGFEERRVAIVLGDGA